MILLKTQPQLADLHELIDKIDHYPITATEVVELAKNEGAPLEVINFYRTFQGYPFFTDKEDLLTRTENIKIMHLEEDEPAEIYSSSEED